MKCQMLLSADDRTGALEIGGEVASEQHTVPVGPNATSTRCCVVDIASRHVSPSEAADLLHNLHRRPAEHRSHKMDSGLRGNWPYEIAALVDLGYRVAVVPSYPSAGRRCRDGVVYIQDVPVLESPFGQDPLTAPVSSKPIEVLEHAGCLSQHVAVWDADNDAELTAAVQRCHQENRVLVGPSGAVAAYAASVLPETGRSHVPIEPPVLLVCGSLNATSRQQIGMLDGPVFHLDDAMEQAMPLAMLVTDQPNGEIDNSDAVAMAQAVAMKIRDIGMPYRTLFVIGGDTSAAIVGDETLDAIGMVYPGIPISRFRDSLLVTKGGGIGTRDTVASLLGRL
jgi:uncharacterized protein YgbK (DUF1537 family)